RASSRGGDVWRVRGRPGRLARPRVRSLLFINALLSVPYSAGSRRVVRLPGQGHRNWRAPTPGKFQRKTPSGGSPAFPAGGPVHVPVLGQEPRLHGPQEVLPPAAHEALDVRRLLDDAPPVLDHLGLVGAEAGDGPKVLLVQGRLAGPLPDEPKHLLLA